MIVRSHGRDVAVRLYQGEDFIPSPGSADSSSTGLRVTTTQAIGIPAVLGVIQLIVLAGGQLPMMVYRPSGEGSEKARDTWQWDLLHTQPSPPRPPSQTWSYVLACMLGHGAAAMLKLKARRRVVGLMPQDPRTYTVRRVDGELRFEFRGRGRSKTLTREDILYVPCCLLDDPEIGVTPLTVARDAMAVGHAQQQFEGRYYQTDGSPSDVVTLPGTPKRAQRDEFLESWERRHQPGSRRTGLLWGGATYESIGLSLKDAQYAEAAALTKERAADIFGMPLGMVKPSDDGDPLTTNARFRELTVQPRLTSIEQACWADDDIFPDKTLASRFLTNALLRPSLKDRADAYRLFRQGGILTANEIRALDDYPEHPDGDELLMTPVGAAPNPAKAATSDFD